MIRSRFATTIYACCLWMTLSTNTAVQAFEAPTLPADPSAWINSPPLSLQQLKGKAVVFWFYEETCPRCRERWPALMDTSQKMSDRPVVFIAVNSGNSPSDVRDYADSLRVTWPIIADTDRSLEKAFRLDEITLQNVTQICYVTADGSAHDGKWDKVDETIADALEDAAWKLDPSEVPDALKDTWRAVEYGSYKSAAATLKKSATSPKKELAEGAKKLQAVVKKSLSDDVEAAKKESEAGHHWRAFEMCQQINDRYGAAEMPTELADLKKSLLKENEVKTGAASKKVVETALKGLNSGRPVSKKVKAQLDKIVNDYSDSDLARDAQQALEKAASTTEQRGSMNADQ